MPATMSPALHSGTCSVLFCDLAEHGIERVGLTVMCVGMMAVGAQAMVDTEEARTGTDNSAMMLLTHHVNITQYGPAPITPNCGSRYRSCYLYYL